LIILKSHLKLLVPINTSSASKMYYLLSASLLLVPFLLSVPIRAAPTALANAETYERRSALAADLAITKRRAQEHPPIPEIHVPHPEVHPPEPPRVLEHHPIKREASPEADSNVKLQPTKRWGGWGAGGCCGSGSHGGW
jgi:hypothetical protein